jgi:hypothetical protein
LNQSINADHRTLAACFRAAPSNVRPCSDAYALLRRHMGGARAWAGAEHFLEALSRICADVAWVIHIATAGSRPALRHRRAIQSTQRAPEHSSWDCAWRIPQPSRMRALPWQRPACTNARAVEAPQPSGARPREGSLRATRWCAPCRADQARSRQSDRHRAKRLEHNVDWPSGPGHRVDAATDLGCGRGTPSKHPCCVYSQCNNVDTQRQCVVVPRRRCSTVDANQDSEPCRGPCDRVRFLRYCMSTDVEE